MSTTTTTKPTVATPSGAYGRMSPRWARIDALLGGTEALRAAGDVYLPQHDKESNRAYQNRLARTTLVNCFEDTLDTLSGKPFSEDVVLGDDVPKKLETDVLDDVDMQGNALLPFCRAWFRTGWAKGFSHVLVEHARPERKFDADGNPLPRTLEDDRREGLRPYWVHIIPENVIAAYSEAVDGKERLVHVRIKEESTERSGWEEVLVQRVRVLEPGTWELHRYNPKNKEWELEDNGLTGLDEIPLRTFYAGKREGLMECKPPLTDLAYLNIAHWQSSSDQRNILTVARFPILAAAGVDADTEVKIGPNNFLTTEDPQGKWYYVEHTGAAIEAGAADLATLEDQMSRYGAEYLRKKPGNETATGRALDSAEASSYLGATVRAFEDVVAEVLDLTARWMKITDGGGTISLKGDFTLEEAEAAELDALIKMRATRDISRFSLIEEMKRRKVLRDDHDFKEDGDMLDEEGTEGLGGDMFNGGQGTQGNLTAPPVNQNGPGGTQTPPAEEE